MKRIPSKCAVSTILSVTSPRQNIRIVDFTTLHAYTNWEKPTEVYKGKNDLNSYQYAKITASQVRGIETHTHSEGSQLVLKICMSADEY